MTVNSVTKPTRINMSITFDLATRATLVTLTTSSPVSDLLRMVPPSCTVCVNHIMIDPRKHAGVLGTPLATLGLDPDVVHHVQVDSPPVQIFIKHASCGTRTLSISLDAQRSAFGTGDSPAASGST